MIRQRGWPGKMALPQSVILTPHTEMSMKFMVEISRGCPCMCRFCWAGYNYLPVRGFSRADIIARAREVRPHANKIGLVSTAVCDHPEIEAIVDDLAGLNYEVSVASLRLDDLTPEFVFKLADTGVHGLTLAPECGTDRMRNILNKQFTNTDILDRATWIFENGIQNLKLYYMVGLPWERHEDVEGIVTLTEQIRDRMIQVGRSRGRVGRIHPSVNPFVPKPGTPYQWLPMEDPKETDRKLQFLRKAFGRMANVDAVIKSARTGVSQSILALADRRVADALEHAAVENVDLKRGMKAVGLDPGFYLFRGRGREENLPWDIVDNGVSKAYYLRELDKSAQEKLSPHCPEIQGCIRCAVCIETPNPSYRLPEKWKALGTLAPVPQGGGVVKGARVMTSWMMAACLAMAACGNKVGTPSGEKVPLGREFTLARRGSRRSWTTTCGSRLKSVTDDSRCPVDVTCVWEGDAKVAVEVITPTPRAEHELHTSGRDSREAKHGAYRDHPGQARARPAQHHDDFAERLPRDVRRRALESSHFLPGARCPEGVAP